MVVYEDDEVRAIWHPGQTDYMLITFADLVSLATAPDAPSFAQAPVLKSAISSVGFIAKTPNWYAMPSMFAAIDAVEKLLAPYKQRVLYGGSMGGFAAIKYSRLLGATQVLALCPQWSIDPMECRERDPGYGDLVQPYMAAMGIRHADVAGRIYLFFDPDYAVDRWHARQIERNSGGHAVSIPVPMTDHHLTTIFAGTANLILLIETCRVGTPEQLRVLVNHWRRHSAISLDILLRRAAVRHPVLALRAAACPRAAPSGFARSGDGLYFPVVRAMLARGQFVEAARHLEKIAPTLPLEERLRADVTREAIVAGVLESRQSLVMTFHGTLLVYDLLAGELRHLGWGEYLAHKFAYTPVLIRLGQGIPGLHVFLKEALLLLQVEPGGRARLVLDQAERSQVEFEIAPVRVEEGAYTFRREGLYLCAEPGGRVTVTRPVAAKWEEFHLALA